MEDIQKLIKIRKDIIEKSIVDNTLSEESILESILPELENAKIIETPEIIYSYFLQDGMKINGYDINSNGERLILFVLNSNSINFNLTEDEIFVSSKDVYENVFRMTSLFVQKAIKRHIYPPSDKVGVLISQLQKNEFINDIDVVEIIQISLTASIDKRGNSNSLRIIDFNEEKFNVSYTLDNKSLKKDIIIKRKLIDLNFLKDVIFDNSALTKLVVDFEKYTNGAGLKALEAVNTTDFTSYLAVIPAQIISDLYKNESTKLLENNVRSFLSFKKDANRGMQNTIKIEPEKFIAYNNGLTITATDAEVEKNGSETIIKKLSDFQIVNGGQTTATIYFTKKDDIDISKVFLMAKINVLKSTDATLQNEQNKLLKFISDISLYSNTQSKVDSVDFTSRSEEVKQIKRLSTNIHPPTADRWFFELMKGEFNTMIALESNEKKKKKLKDRYPKNRILDIKNFGKYWGAWGDIPYLVKLGGVKFNGIFLKTLKSIGIKELDRDFYEDAIAKCILWESFFNIYGAGRNSIGQLRSAVVPYSISAIFLNTDGAKGKTKFNFTKIWKEQRINKNFEIWGRDLMVLINDLIKKYPFSDNIEDGTKRKEQWDKIKSSVELKDFFNSPNSILVLNEYKKTEKNKRQIKEVDFSELYTKIEVLNNGYEFYENLKNLIINTEIKNKDKVIRVINKLFIKHGDEYKPQEISYGDASFLYELLISLNNNYNLNKQKVDYGENYVFCLNKIIEIYNNCINQSSDIVSEFTKFAEIAEIKNVKYAPSVLRKIGKSLKVGEPPSISDIYISSSYFQENKNDEHRAENYFEKEKIYLKKIINQDLERTPTFSIEAIYDFFKIDIEEHGQSEIVKIKELYSGKVFDVEFKLRETRGEYRVFLKELLKEISPREKDILIFRATNDSYFTCEHISSDSSEYILYSDEFEDNKNHKLLI
jgi:hypothetical protein